MSCTAIHTSRTEAENKVTYYFTMFQLLHKLFNGRKLVWIQSQIYCNLTLVLGIELEVGFEAPPLFFQLTHLTLKAAVDCSQLCNRALLQHQNMCILSLNAVCDCDLRRECTCTAVHFPTALMLPDIQLLHVMCFCLCFALQESHTSIAWPNAAKILHSGTAVA